MRYILDAFALIGLCATITAAGFYAGYVTYQPECGSALAVFTKECK